jgi:DNA processing protein
VDCAAARGPHRLLRQGARLVESVEDILQELETLIPVPARAPAAPTVPPPSEEERRVLALLENDDVDVDTLTRLSGLPAARVSVMLMALEMKRRVRMLPGRRVALRRSE